MWGALGTMPHKVFVGTDLFGHTGLSGLGKNKIKINNFI